MDNKFRENATIVLLVKAKERKQTRVCIGGIYGKLEWEWDLQLGLEVLSDR